MRTICPKAESISCPVGQNFLGKYVPLDTFSWQTQFPLTPAKVFAKDGVHWFP